jgi:hypothetical protein
VSDIYFWSRKQNDYGWLSNFYRAPITIEGKTWPTSEHYYQAMKTNDPKQQEMVWRLPTPKDAKFAGSHLTLRPDWEEVKEGYMLTALRAKFSQHPELKRRLLATGDASLHEDSPWDKYWGYVKGEGRDRLGVLLMQVREELRG